MNEYRTGQSSINCEVCGLTHETGPTPDTVCVRALKEQVARLREALTIQKNANRLHHDWDAYLFDVCEWGLGERAEKPEWKDEE